MSCLIYLFSSIINIEIVSLTLNSAGSIRYEIIITKIGSVISLEEIKITKDLCFLRWWLSKLSGCKNRQSICKQLYIFWHYFLSILLKISVNNYLIIVMLYVIAVPSDRNKYVHRNIGACTWSVRTNLRTDASMACLLSERTLRHVINLKWPCNRIYHDCHPIKNMFRLSRNIAQYNVCEANSIFSEIRYNW